MNIIVDAFGGDNAPLEIIKGCVEAVAEYNINVTLTGDETKIKNMHRYTDDSGTAFSDAL